MRLALLFCLLCQVVGSEPRVQIPVTFWHPGLADWRTFDQLEYIRQDVACGQHPPGNRPAIQFVGKVVADGFEIHFSRPLCSIRWLIADQNSLCLDGVELGKVTFVLEQECYFKLQTDAQTSQRLLEALGSP